MKQVLEYKGDLVTVMVVEPNGVWAMVRKHGAMPFCVRWQELSVPTKDAPDLAVRTETQHNPLDALCTCRECWSKLANRVI